MPLTLQEFVDQVAASSLMSAQEIEAVVEGASADKYPRDAEQLARFLVRTGKLTSFQAQQCYGGKGKSLVLGNYVLLDKLGQGGMGMVLKAEHKRMRRIVALKVLAPAVSKDPALVARFHREVEAAAKLSHPNIVAAYDADEANGVAFLVMEYVEGTDLSSLVKKKGPLPIEEAIQCILQTATGLEYAHKQGIIHRDIKPANLLLTHEGVVKILDMGLARIEGETGGQAELTSTGAVMGTVDYMAPEQALSTKHADARSDIYSLGIALWYLCKACPAYDGDSLMARLLAHRESPIPSLLPAKAPANSTIVEWTALDAIFQKMAAKMPNDRYQSMTDVIVALNACKQGESSTPSMTTSPGEVSKLSNFLAGLGTKPLRDRGNSVSPGASPTAVTKPLPEFAVTITTNDSDVPTNLQTLSGLPRVEAGTKPHLPGSRSETHAATNWWRSRGARWGSAAALALLVLVIAFTRNPDSDQPHSSDATEFIASTVTTEKQVIERFSLEFDGVDDHVELPNDWQYAGGDFTFEAWITPDAVLETGSNMLFVVDHGHDTERQSLRLMRRHINQAGAIISDKLQMCAPPNTTVSSGYYRVEAGRRIHLAAVWTGREQRLFIDGQPAQQEDTEYNFNPRGMVPYAWIGALGEVTDKPTVIATKDGWPGRIDQVRLTSKAVYDGSFVPPVDLTPTVDTIALYRFTDGQGDVLTDSSGHHRHGKIVGAKWVQTATRSTASDNSPDRRATEMVIGDGGNVRLVDSPSSFSTLDQLPE
ncbi:MAG: protein kinase domain-containing protein [Planctomycetaceae bacterium]